MRAKDDIDEDEREFEIEDLKVNKDGLNIALNTFRRQCLTWLAPEGLKPARTFCTGSSEPSLDIILIKITLHSTSSPKAACISVR